MEKNRGITLVVLIVTIIVMLILVAVSVNILIKSNLIGTAEKAADKYKTASEEEKSGVIEIDGKKYNSIEDYLNKKPASTIKIKMEVTHEDTAIPTDDGKYTLTSENVPIPVGYYYVGGTKDTGVVISDNENDKDKGDAHSVSATLQGNQFVWVPVLQNQKIKIEVTAEDTITSVELKDSAGNTITTTSPTGKTYTESVNPTINGLYLLTVKTENETNTEIIRVSTLYAQDTWGISKESFKAEIEQYATDNNKTEEEVLKERYSELENPTIDSAYSKYLEEIFSTGSVYTDNADTAEETIALYNNSVNKYGGFYIARYEAGSENKRDSSRGTTDVVLSQANKYPYNYINQTNSITKAKEIANGKTNVTAGLINGAAWDRTLNWILETNSSMSLADINKDCKSWGNYLNSQFNFTGKYSTNEGSSFNDVMTSTEKPENSKYLLGTGVTDYTKKNNIYDLAGNCSEWTTETFHSILRISKGRLLLLQ